MTKPRLEAALGQAVRWLVPPLVVTPLLLLTSVPANPMAWAMTHLGVVVLLGLVLAMSLGKLLDEPWFANLGPMARLVASATNRAMALTTGVVALVTIASSAALRLEPSLQFLQLLSALDIAWAAGATALGLRMLFGPVTGWSGGLFIVAICLWSVGTYLHAVGFTPAGGWLVDGAAMWTYILPYDMAAAVIAISSLVAGSRRAARRDGVGTQPMAHPSRQS
ncbi:hypothetical protein BH23ACT5_BH23ACT5_22410 [soil metagenome]